MSKTFGEFVKEQSIHLGSGKKYPSVHTVEPHVSHSLDMAPTGEHDKTKKKLNELLGTLALGAAAGALAYRAVTKKGGAVDRVAKEREKKAKLKDSIKKSEEHIKDLKNKLSKTSTTKAFFNMQEATRKLSTAERLARNLERGGYNMAASEKKNKELEQRNTELRAKYADLLKKEEAGPVSVAGGAVPSITDPTTNYAAQLKKKTNMLRRKKPQ